MDAEEQSRGLLGNQLLEKSNYEERTPTTDTLRRLLQKMVTVACVKTTVVHSALRQRSTVIRKVVAIAGVVLVLALFSHLIPSTRSVTTHREYHHSPFTGAFARFPTISALPPRQKRITLLAVWNDDVIAPYLRHFYYTAQKNADVADVLVINRIVTPGRQCLDLAKANIDATWGANVKIVCLKDEEYRKYLVDHMCSRKYGWNCNTMEYQDVTVEFAKRPDAKNYDWRPLSGYAFRSLFQNPQNPLWAWIDQDDFLGDFRRYPFNILSQVSLMSSLVDDQSAEFALMAGQLTGWNMDDEATGGAWKKFTGLRSAQDFINHPDGAFPSIAEEQLWSEGYMRSTVTDPGHDLSYVMYQGLHGDDYFDGRWKKTGSTHTHILSGRTLMLVDKRYTREQIELMIALERAESLDETGGIGWTGGEDGSAYLLENPALNASEAKQSAVEFARANLRGSDGTTSVPVYSGILDIQPLKAGCITGPAKNWYHTCVTAHPLAKAYPPIYRTSLIRFKEQPPMEVFRRLELNDKRRGYERKLIRHHLHSKKRPDKEFGFPPFDITDDLVLSSNWDYVEAWRMGESRDKTLYYRAAGAKPIG